MANERLKSGTNPLAKVDEDLTKDRARPSNDVIYEAIMRGGGEPFGKPFARGVATLTEKIVKLFGQKSFFGFETLEKPRRRKNKFTRYGAARYFGTFRKPRAPTEETRGRRKKKRR